MFKITKCEDCRAVARTLMGGGGCLFTYSCSARLVSFQIDRFEFDFQKTSRAEHEYMNKHPPPPINVLATAVEDWVVYLQFALIATRRMKPGKVLKVIFARIKVIPVLHFLC